MRGRHSRDRATLVEETFAALVEIGARPHGSIGAERAVDTVAGILSGLGLDVREERFAAPAPRVDAGATLVAAGRTVPCVPFLESVGGSAEGPLVPHGKLSVWGMYEWDVLRVGEVEARAFVAVRPDGPAIAQHLPEESMPVPHVAVGTDDGAVLLREAAGGTLVARVEVSGEAPATEGRSLRAFAGRDPLGAGKSLPLVVAHYDTVPGTPGAYDNAAGVAALVACAEAVARGEPTAHFLVAGGEEVGLAGSRDFAARLAGEGVLERVPAVIVLDGGGRGRLLEAWLGPGSLQTRIAAPLQAAAHACAYEVAYRSPAPPGSDHQAFRERGVPAVMLTVNDLAILHRPDDGPDPRKLESARLLAACALAVLPALAPEAV